MTRLDRSTLAPLSYGSGSLKLDELSEPARAALADAGITPEKLAQIAGSDRKISGWSEWAALGAALQKSGPDLALGRDAALLDTLKGEVAANRAVQNARTSLSRAEQGLGRGHKVIDTNHLSPELSSAMARASVSREELGKIAGVDGQIKGKAEWSRLLARLDQADGKDDGKIATKTKSARGEVVDTAAGAALEALRAEVTRNRADARTAQPGTIAAEQQPQLLNEIDALRVPAGARKPDVDLGVRGVNQFSLYPGDPEKGGRACWEASVKMARDHNAANGDRAQLAGNDQVIQVATQEDKDGRIVADETQAKIARAYIDRTLEAGRPVVVGVSLMDDSYNADKMTDHYVTIDRRFTDEQGRLCYGFKDPGDNGRAGVFYVDASTGKLFREGDQLTRFVGSLDYEVTQVRTYRP